MSKRSFKRSRKKKFIDQMKDIAKQKGVSAKEFKAKPEKYIQEIWRIANMRNNDSVQKGDSK